ncbi:MAG TPA: VanZ family protein [Chitinophagaceae bacterium]|nr:VanZ family protein [Chitinophagaceae bacterium]
MPVTIVSLVYLPVIYRSNYEDASFKRLAGFAASIFLLYLWIIVMTIQKQQSDFFRVLVQSSFFVYVFAVLQLTGYFILFKEVSSYGWWDKMNHRIDTTDHVNLSPFKTMRMYGTFDKQVIGNFIMLLPLGLYLPLLIRVLRRLSGFFGVLLISLLVSVGIELLQLATNYRSTDVDDVLLNTTGACFGFLFYQLLKVIILKNRQRAETTSPVI